MKETYYLNKDTLPVMPVPHDNIISHITVDNEFLTFILETDPEDKDDSIQYYKPGAKGLMIRYHLCGGIVDIYQMKYASRCLFRKIPPRFIMLENTSPETLTKGKYRLEYLDHYVNVEAIVFRLFSGTEIRLEAYVDYVEYDWLF